jgi:hypothetical protein
MLVLSNRIELWLHTLQECYPATYADVMEFFSSPGYGRLEISANDGKIVHVNYTRGHRLNGELLGHAGKNIA